MHRWSLLSRAALPGLAACVLFAACPRAVPRTGLDSADAGIDPREATVDAVEAEVAEALRVRDEALWRHWTTGAPLDPAAMQQTAAPRFGPDTLARLRGVMRPTPDDVTLRARHLEAWLGGQLLSHALADDDAALADVEAGLTFRADGQEVPWRELGRRLLNERSALKRRALWSEALTVVGPLDEALAQREMKADEAARALGWPSAMALAAQARDVDLSEVADAARDFLDATDEAWQATLKKQSAATVRLPLARLTRAELPRLLHPRPEADAAFPRGRLAANVVALLGRIGLYGQPGLTLDLNDGAAKQPLPLTVAPTSRDVRTSFKPAGGLRDQASLLSEVGAALASSQARTGHLATERLGDPAAGQLMGDVFASLLTTPEWLESVGVDGNARRLVIDAVRAERLFQLRRAAGVVLARVETAGLDAGEAQKRTTEVLTRALGVADLGDESARWRIETDDFLRSATQLKAAAYAQVLRQREPADWFASPQRFAPLAEAMAAGTSTPLSTRYGPLREAVHALAQHLTQPALQAGPWPQPASAAPQPAQDDAGLANVDGGLRPGPWPQPATVAPQPAHDDAGLPNFDGGLRPGSWPQPATVAPPTAQDDAGLSNVDGGLRPGPWPQPATVAPQSKSDDAGLSGFDAGLHAGPWPEPATVQP